MHGDQMLSWAKALFPLSRSLTGEGTRKTLDFFEKINPEFQRLTFPSGMSVLDWTVPKEWVIRNAWLEHESGERFADFSVNNLHVLGYSTPVDIRLDREALEPHLYTEPTLPSAIPYVTSYYKERWGFCLSEEVKQALPSGEYHAYIDSDLFDGHIDLSHALISGRSDQELFFSSYVCHPSMANNELSGPVVLNALLQYIKNTYPNPRMSYRFLLGPETIGALAYLSNTLDALQKRVVSGFVLTCVGDERAYSHIQTPDANTLADQALEAALIGKENPIVYSFVHRGSDERQYCSPNVDLPICGFCRSKFAEYPEYHTSADNFDLVTANGLQGALDTMKAVVDAFELGLYPRLTVIGEPQMGKRSLYPTLSKKNNYGVARTRMDILAFANGSRSLFEIAKILKQPLGIVIAEVGLLLQAGVLEVGDELKLND